MILYYREINGDVIEARLDYEAIKRDTSDLSTIEAILIYEIDEIIENKSLIKNILENRYTIDEVTGLHPLYVEAGILYRRDTGTPITPVIDVDRDNLRTQYQTAKDTLTTIINASTLNTQQMIDAIQFEANVLLNILELAKKKWG